MTERFFKYQCLICAGTVRYKTLNSDIGEEKGILFLPSNCTRLCAVSHSAERNKITFLDSQEIVLSTFEQLVKKYNL